MNLREKLHNFLDARLHMELAPATWYSLWVKTVSWLSRKSGVGFPLGRVSDPDRWIFIVGCYSSGTTLLQRLLGTHPEIGILPDEGVFLTDVLNHPDQYGWTRMWHRCREKLEIDFGELPDSELRRLKKQWSLWYPAAVPSLLEKSVANTVRMPFLQAHFQPAYFIYLVRNGYAVAEGLKRKSRPGRWNNPEYEDEYPMEQCARQWVVSDDVARADSDQLERFLEIRYEDLTENPGKTLAKITDFLEVSPLAEENWRGSWSIHEKDSTIRNMNERSFVSLSLNEIDAIERVAGDKLRDLGYDFPKKFY